MHGNGETSKHVDIDFTPEENGIRTFVNDGEQQSMERFCVDDSVWSLLRKNGLSDHQIHDVIKIASRSREIANITIRSGTAQGTTILTYDPSTFFTDILNVRQKLDGFLGLDTSIKIVIKITTERQSQGGLSYVNYYPQAKTIADNNDFLSNVILWSTCATHFNVVTESSAEIIIPYLSTSLIYSPNTGTDPSDLGFWSILVLKVIAPYLSPTGSDLKLTVYASLENLSVYIPITPSINPPTTMSELTELYKLISFKPHNKISREDLLAATKTAVEQLSKPLFIQEIGDSKDKPKPENTTSKSGGMPSINITNTNTSNSSVGGIGGKPISDKELKKEKRSGLVGELVTGANKLIQKLPDVPVIKEFKSAAEVAAPTAKKIASAFGMGKPGNHYISDTVEQFFSQNMHNVDGIVNEYNLGFSCHQENAVDSLARTDVDDMAILTIAKRRAVIFTGTIDTTMAPGKVLFKTAVDPYRMASGSGPLLIPSPLSFVSLFGYNWTGDIHFKVTFFGNPFQSFLIDMCMFYNISDATIVDGFTIDDNYNKVIDATNLASEEYVVEWKSQNPWKRTLSERQTFENPSTGLSSLGTFAMFLKNKLICSESTSQSLAFIVEVYAGDNFEINGPQAPTYTFLPDPTSLVFNQEMNSSAVTNSTATDMGSGLIKTEYLSNLKNALMFGNHVKSLKQFLHIETLADLFQFNYATPGASDMATVYPYAYLIPRIAGQSTTTNLLSIIGKPFAFFSGDIRVIFFIESNAPLDGSLTRVKYDIAINPTAQGALPGTRVVLTSSQIGTPPNISYFDGPGANLMVQSTLQSRIPVKQPFYMPRPIALMPIDNTWETNIELCKFPPGGITIAKPRNVSSYTGTIFVRMYIAGSENLRFAYWNGLSVMRFNLSSFVKVAPTVTPPP